MKFYKSLGLYNLFYILDDNPQKENFYKNGIIFSTNYEKEIMNVKEQICKNGFAAFLIILDNKNAQKINDDTYKIEIKNINNLDLLIKHKMKILDAYYGREYIGITPKTGFKNKNIQEQFLILNKLMDSYMNDFSMEIMTQWILVISNFIYWKKFDFIGYGITKERKNEILKRIIYVLNKMHKNYFFEK